MSNNNIKFSDSKNHFHHWIYSYYQSSFFHFPYGRFENKLKNYTEKPKLYFKEKRSDAVIVLISNCNNHRSIRLEYISILKQFYPVALYGVCFGTRLPDIIKNKLIRNHRYILSFENSYCLDYTTEKYWQGLRYGAIPIVLSHEKNKDLLIPNSYIDALNFSHPYYLAQYLKELNKNGSHKKFHEWREYYTDKSDIREMDTCDILEKIQNILSSNKLLDETVDKIGDNSICTSPEEYRSKVLQPLL